jgi:hypothetical protein
MHARDDLDAGSGRDEVHEVREAPYTRSASALVNLREAFWTSPDLSKTSIDSPKKIGS